MIGRTEKASSKRTRRSCRHGTVCMARWILQGVLSKAVWIGVAKCPQRTACAGHGAGGFSHSVRKMDDWTNPDDHIDVWLKTVVVNCCRTEMQKMSYHADAPLLDSVTIPGADEELPFVDRLPLGLSESEKKVLQCFYEYRLSHKDIAQLYGISLEASRMKLFRARMHCRELLLKCEKYV